MALIRPRLTDYYGLSSAQEDIDFAIPFFDEDLPLYVDPFLLWRSPSQQDNALHTSILNSFNHLNRLLSKGDDQAAIDVLIEASECDEVGLGLSRSRTGVRIGRKTAAEITRLFQAIPSYAQGGFAHFEEIQLYVDGISKDRISDIACNFLKSFLIDYTVEQCLKHSIPISKHKLPTLYDYRTQRFLTDIEVDLPTNPLTNLGIILVPKRWLRFTPWINFEDYFATACPKDDVINQKGSDERVSVLLFNRDNYGVVQQYVRSKELCAIDCHNDPLFKQIPILSARRKLNDIKKLPTGKADNSDRKYEDAISQLMASLLYPDLDFADTQSRSVGGATIKDLVFYNNRSVDFLSEILQDYHSRQIVMEIKNVKEIERDHINQLNRYLTNEFGDFGFLITRNPLSRAMFKNTVELWSGQRKCIIALHDTDLSLMVEVFESKQRKPIEVLKRAYLDFRRACPS